MNDDRGHMERIKTEKRDIELFRVGTMAVMVISAMVLKGLVIWVKERKS